MFADCHGPLGLAMTCGGWEDGCCTQPQLCSGWGVTVGASRGRETFLLLNCSETCLSVGYYLLNSHDDHITCNRDRTRT